MRERHGEGEGGHRVKKTGLEKGMRVKENEGER